MLAGMSMGWMSLFLGREAQTNSTWKGWGGQSRAAVNSDQAAPSQPRFNGFFFYQEVIPRCSSQVGSAFPYPREPRSGHSCWGCPGSCSDTPAWQRQLWVLSCAFGIQQQTDPFLLWFRCEGFCPPGLVLQLPPCPARGLGWEQVGFRPCCWAFSTSCLCLAFKALIHNTERWKVPVLLPVVKSQDSFSETAGKPQQSSV